MSRAIAAAGLCLCVIACDAEPADAPMPDPAHARIDEAGEGPVQGRIAGEPWQLSDARFRVERREGRERVDLLLWDRPIERCGLSIEREGTALWLRFLGRIELEPGELARGADGGPFEVHYEVPHERGFTSVHRGVGEVRIDAVEERSVRGRLRVCFADPEQSCVGGTFDAAPCWSRIDGRTLREPPGLRDEALEPLPREAP